jgi:UDP-glucose 4-epimerase
MQKEELTAVKKERVLITGNAGSLGKALTKQLLKNKSFQIIGVDRRELDPIPHGVEHFALDLRRKSALETLRKIKPSSIIHLGVIRNPHIHRSKKANAYFFNLESTTQLLQFAESTPIRKFVFLSTANLYGPSANSSGILTEETPLHGANKSPEFRDLVALDMMMQSFFWKQPYTETIILRPCHIIGPNLRNAPTRYLKLDTIPTILGFDPMIQLLHVSDLISAIVLSLKSKVRGIFNLAGPDVAPLSRIIGALNRPTLPVFESVLKAFIASAFFSRRSSFPMGELDHLKYSCIIDDSRARKELSFKPKRKISSIISELKKLHAIEQVKKDTLKGN